MPRDEAQILKHAVSDFEIGVEFLGYAGCWDGTMDLDGDGTEDTEFVIEDRSLSYPRASRTAWCRCYGTSGFVDAQLAGVQFARVEAGSLYCSWSVQHAKVLATPQIDFSLVALCPTCTQAYDNNTQPITNNWGQGTNPVKACAKCTLASAQAVRWKVWASPVWESTPNEFLVPHRDDNSAHGTTAAYGGVFRGAAKSEVEFSLIPVRYEDSIDVIEAYAYRLQATGTNLGSTANFDIQLAWHNETQFSAADLTTDPGSEVYAQFYQGSLLKNFIKEASFVEEDLSNEVHFSFILNKADVMLAVNVDKWCVTRGHTHTSP